MIPLIRDQAMLLEQSDVQGWTLTEAIDRVPDLASRLATGNLVAWGHIGNQDSALVLIAPSTWPDMELPAKLEENGQLVFTGGEPIFDLRIFPLLLRSPKAAEYLNGLTLAEAFRKYVLGDSEVAALGRRLMQVRPGHSAVFLEGQAPGAFVDFHWPLKADAGSIAFRFVSLPLLFLDEPLPKPSALEAEVSEALADRIEGLVGCLASDEVVAVGTFEATGVEGPIGPGQWTREDLSIDVKNSALCAVRDHRPLALWTGIRLQLSEKSHQSLVVQSEEPTKARQQIQTKDKSRRQCAEWLKSVMSDPNIVPWTRDELWAEAQERWPGTLSWRTFEECRRAVLASLTEEQRYKWSRPGPRRKRF